MPKRLMLRSRNALTAVTVPVEEGRLTFANVVSRPQWKRHLANVHATEVSLLRVLPDGTMVERKGKKTLLAISSEPPLQYDRIYNGRHFRVKRY